MADEETPIRGGGDALSSELIRLLVSRASAAADEPLRSIKALPPEHTHLVARRALTESRGADEIAKALGERGLVRSINRARAYTAFSHTLAATKTVTVIPFSSADPKSPHVGGMGFSDGQPANGVVVELDGTSLVRFTTLDYHEGSYSESSFEVADLVRKGPEAHVEERDRGAVEPHLPIGTSVDIATNAFKVLVTDDHSSAVHSPDQLREFMHQLPVVGMIAELQYQRIRGLAASPDVSCCSCCCCCWGCCSCCSAVSSAYVNESYYTQTG
jgi:hypothetical protein